MSLRLLLPLYYLAQHSTTHFDHLISLFEYNRKNMADGHVKGQCATLVSEAEALLTATAAAAEEEELEGVEGMPKTRGRNRWSRTSL